MTGRAQVLLGGLLLLGGAAGLYFAYEAPSFAGAALCWLAIIVGTLVLLWGVARQVSAVMSHDSTDDTGPAEIRLLVQCMGAMAAADRHIANEEVAEFARIHEEMLGLAIDSNEVREILSEFTADSDIVGRLHAARAELTPQMRQTILKSCYRVMASDKIEHRAEKNLLDEIGLALGFYEEQIDSLLAEAGRSS